MLKVVAAGSPGCARQGVGTALLRILADHAAAQGFQIAGSNVDDPGSLAFAEYFGFRRTRISRSEPNTPTPRFAASGGAKALRRR
ncbi:MAG TPA: hypothetical protein DGT23_05155 [Micromonosporaceae bacterium]|nr:hypothetical protein [Micromonosporaceae bacterium]